MAELPPDEKNCISHRGQAARKAKEVLLAMLTEVSSSLGYRG
jgi:inosine/xanthosine triphosphate pyrophosphatase family protein